MTALVLELVEGPTLAERLSGVGAERSSGVGADPRVGPKGGHTGPPLRVNEVLKIAAQSAPRADTRVRPYESTKC